LKFPECQRYARDKYRVEIQPSQYRYLEASEIPDFHRYTPSGTRDCPSLVVIDETHIFLNARDWFKASRELLIFLTQSRKVFTDIMKTWKAIALGMAAGVVMMYAGAVALTKSFTLRSSSVCAVADTNPVTDAAIAATAGSSKEKVREVKSEPVRKLPVMVSLIEYAGKRFVERSFMGQVWILDIDTKRH
jgi:hypothetical protein